MIRVLAGIHDRGYIPLDLKPENIMVYASDPDSLALVDYGGALKIIDETGHHVKSNLTVLYKSNTTIFATLNIHRSLSR